MDSRRAAETDSAGGGRTLTIDSDFRMRWPDIDPLSVTPGCTGKRTAGHFIEVTTMDFPAAGFIACNNEAGPEGVGSLAAPTRRILHKTGRAREQLNTLPLLLPRTHRLS